MTDKKNMKTNTEPETCELTSDDLEMVAGGAPGLNKRPLIVTLAREALGAAASTGIGGEEKVSSLGGDLEVAPEDIAGLQVKLNT